MPAQARLLRRVGNAGQKDAIFARQFQSQRSQSAPDGVDIAGYRWSFGGDLWGLEALGAVDIAESPDA